MRRSICSLLIAAIASAGCTAGAAAQHDRRQRLGAWLVEDRTDEDGRVVEISRVESGFGVHHHISVLRSDGEHSRGWSIRFRDCNSGDAEPVRDIAAGASPSLTARERLAGYLAECGAMPHETEAMLRGFDIAYPLFREWGAQLAAAQNAGPRQR